MYRIKGALLVLMGLFLVGLGVFLTGSWIAFCFGTIIVGVLLLFLAPLILLFPYALIAQPGWNLINNGIVVYRRATL